MLQIDSLSIAQLKDKKTLQEISDLVIEYREANNVGDAKDLLGTLRELLKDRGFENSDPELFSAYADQAISLELVAMTSLPEQEVASLLEKYCLRGFREGVDLFSNLEVFFVLFRDPLTGDLSRSTFTRALSSNIEKIGSKHLQAGNLQVPPTIGNWIRDYSRGYPSDKVLTHLEELEYVNTNPNTRLLTHGERDLLLKVIRLYDYLRFPGSQSGQIIETGHRAATVGAPKVVLTPLPKDPIARLKQRYQSYRRDAWGVLYEEDRLMVQTKGDVDQVKRELALASRADNKNRLIACLKILSSQQALASSLQSSPAWLEAVKGYIVGKYGPKAEPEALQSAVANIRDYAGSPAIVSEFLQYLLREKMKMSENDSALVAVELGQLLGEEFQGLAYGDEGSGSFVWEKNSLKNGKLVNEG